MFKVSFCIMVPVLSWNRSPHKSLVNGAGPSLRPTYCGRQLNLPICRWLVHDNGALAPHVITQSYKQKKTKSPPVRSQISFPDKTYLLLGSLLEFALIVIFSAKAWFCRFVGASPPRRKCTYVWYETDMRHDEEHRHAAPGIEIFQDRYVLSGRATTLLLQSIVDRVWVMGCAIRVPLGSTAIPKFDIFRFHTQSVWEYLFTLTG